MADSRAEELREIFEWFQRVGTVFIAVDSLALIIIVLIAFGPSIRWPLG